MTDTTTDEFMQAGSFPALKFENPGHIAVITVRSVDKKVDTQPDGAIKKWPNGDPMHVFVFTGESDGETKSLWVRGNMVTAIRDAVTKAGLSTVVGAKVTIKFTEFGTPTQKGFSPPKLFVAKVEAGAPPVADPFAANDDEPF